jgi:xylulokinase
LKIDPVWMPPIYEGPEFAGRVTFEAANATGLKLYNPVIASAGDQAAQMWPDITDACRQVIKVTEVTIPDGSQAEMYREMYPLYRQLYPALKSSFQKMT